MDPLSSLALAAVLAAVGFYTLYRVIRAAVAGGIRDAARKAESASAHHEAAAPPPEPPDR